MKQLGIIIALIATIAAGYALTSPVSESLATLIFGISLISLATVGRITVRREKAN